jgi:hypothetical protein
MKKITLGTFVLALLPLAAFALDFTPHQVLPEGDRPLQQRYYFLDDGKQLFFKIDNKMTVSSAGDAVSFSFKDVVTGSMRLAKSPLPADLALNDKSAETYRAVARSLIPSQGSDVQLQEESSWAVVINGWSSHQYKFLYSLLGVRYCRAITFINLGPQKQIVFDVSAAANEYPKIYARSYRVLNSIGETPLSAINGPT